MSERESYDKKAGILCLPYPRLAEDSLSAQKGDVHILTDNALHESCGTRIAFTFRDGGVSQKPYKGLNLSADIGDKDADVELNRRILLDAVGASANFEYLVNPKQVHGCNCIQFDDSFSFSDPENYIREDADGVVCSISRIPVLLVFADCVPVILVAPDGSFAVLHAGWRGAIESIPAVGLEKLVKATSCLPSEINCYIGPHIDSCCYEVDSGLLKRFVRKFGIGCDAGESKLNLTEAVFRSLVFAGASPERIIDSGFCTSCRTDLLFSYRAESGVTGRHGAFAYREERR